MKPRCAGTLIVVVLAAALGAAADLQLQPIPRPDLSAFEDAVRQKLGRLQDRIDELSATGSEVALADAYGNLGKHYLAHTLREAAEVAFSNAAILAPEDYRWHYYHAFVLRKIGAHEESLGVYERTTMLQPRDVPTWLHYGELLFELTDYEAASRAFRSALEIEPAEATAHAGLAKVANARGDMEAAVEHYVNALEAQPQATSLHYQLALVYRKLGMMDKAREHLALRGEEPVRFVDPLLNQIGPLQRGDIFEIVLEMASKPNEINDREMASFALGHLGEVPGAATKLQAAIDQMAAEANSPDLSSTDMDLNRRARARLGYILAAMLYSHTRYSDCLRETNRVLSLAPQMTEALLLLGHVHEKLGKHEQATVVYGKVLEHDHENPEALRYRASVMSGMKRYSEAALDYERLCALQTGNPEPRIRLAVARAQLEQYDAARESYQLALELNPDSKAAAQVHHHLATIATTSGDTGEAMRRLRTAVSLDPDLSAAGHDLAALLGTEHRYSEAAQVYATIISENPRDARARLGEAVALHLDHRPTEALARLEEGWAAIPESVDLLDALARQLATVESSDLRDGDRALELAHRTFRAGSTFERLETFAMAYAAAGQWNEAIRRQRKLIRSLPPDDAQRDRLKANLARYQEHLPATNKNH